MQHRMLMICLCLASLIAPLADSAAAAPGAREALREMAPDLRAAFNDQDMYRMVTLFHPDSELRVAWMESDWKRDYIRDSFADWHAERGDIRTYTIGRPLLETPGYVVHLTFADGDRRLLGVVMRQDRLGRWRIEYIERDRQDTLELVGH